MRKANLTTKDLLNAKGCSTSLQKIIGETITVTGLATDTTTDNETGKEVQVSYLATVGGVYGAVSATVYNSVDMLIDSIEDGEIQLPLDIMVKGNTSNGGRTFLTISII